MQSEQINELATALSKAQGQIENAKKDTENPFFKSKYADLAGIWDAIRKPLSSNGLSVVQGCDDKENLVTTLMHSSGQFITSMIPVFNSKKDAQGFGSGMTYARRYSLSAIVGITQDDDDGNSASSKHDDIERENRIIALINSCIAKKITEDKITEILKSKSWYECADDRYIALSDYMKSI